MHFTVEHLGAFRNVEMKHEVFLAFFYLFLQIETIH